MSNCLCDCWICGKKKENCTLKNNCAVVFDGVNCKMKKVCNPKRKNCPLKQGKQLLLQEEL